MSLLGRACDKEFWAEVREKDCYARFREDNLRLYQNLCEGREIPELTYSLFKIYFETGSRSEYESVYFNRRLRMNACTFLSLIYPEEEKYLDYLQDVLFAVCNEYTWCLPAHYGQANNDKSLMVDLFAAETGFALAEIYTMLKDRLAPLVASRIEAEIDRRIIEPYATKLNKLWWEKCTNNWAAVCAGSVGGAVMLMRPERFDELRDRLSDTMECYLRGFADDGFCVEGSGYWHYGFGFFTVYADLVKKFTGGELDYFTRPKVRAIATYIQKMFLSGRTSISFADSGTSLAYQIGLVHYLKSVYPDDVAVYDRSLSYTYDGCARFCLHLRTALWYREEYDTDALPDDRCAFFAEGAQWYIKKTPAYGFAAKGGHNNEPHNHNDVGSFIFAKNGVQILADPGTGKYCKDYFGSKRYTFFHTRSDGHSLPIIGGEGQKPGKEFCARDVRVDGDEFVLDIAPAYGIEGLSSIERRFSFTETSASVTDRFDYIGGGEIVERVVCIREPKAIESGKIAILDSFLTYDADAVESVAIEMHTFAGSAPCYTVDLHLKSDKKIFSYTIE